MYNKITKMKQRLIYFDKSVGRETKFTFFYLLHSHL